MRRRAMARLAVAARAFSASASGAGAGGVSMVQGASRGIGLEFVRQLLRRSGEGRVVATCRAPGSAAELQKLKEEHAPGRLTVLPLDVTDENTIEAAAASITETHGSLDLLINSTGILSIPNVIQPVTKTVSVEFGRKDNIACILLHPGTVDTDLSRPFQRNVPKDKLFTREFSVQKLLSIIDNVKKSDNGKFFAWDGQEIPW
ncbi:hypothetical protein SORBI_3008G162300 [Sorghum bicolor]|uniref:Uncharacterized protein n=1 Tax=Sorghum bicolor TaxID=4558 RepID=A0A1Z5R859_SORBI|nr:hypothetical protein SORBI_3008G162300 [Sorghum bicolor]